MYESKDEFLETINNNKHNQNENGEFTLIDLEADKKKPPEY